MLEDKILQRQRKVLKNMGSLADSIEELACPKHPEGSFKKVGKLPFGSSLYICEECEGCKSQAYECENCGAVYGEYRTEWKSSCPGMAAHANTSGTERYYCIVCNTCLGYNSWS